jgi:uncharacterized protein YrzB (UPF0473 family)
MYSTIEYCAIFFKSIRLFSGLKSNTEVYMSDQYGSDFISITDDNGNEFELEHLDTIEYGGALYMAFLPADMDENNEDYGMIILKVIEENGEEILATVDDDQEMEAVYNTFMEQLFSDEDEPED